MKRKIALALVAAVLLGTLGYRTTIAIAQADEGSPHPFVQALSERFNLNENEVDEVFDEMRADHFANRMQDHEDNLNNAVEDGVLTESQASALQEKHQEMWQERNQERTEHMEEMDTWFEENGINHDALHEYVGGSDGYKGMHRMGR